MKPNKKYHCRGVKSVEVIVFRVAVAGFLTRGKRKNCDTDWAWQQLRL